LVPPNNAVIFTFSTPVTTSITYAECSTFDIGCYGKNLVIWAFQISPQTLNKFSTLTLKNSVPFSYLYDIPNVFNALYANTGSMSYTVTANLGTLGEFTFISASKIADVPYSATIKTLLGYILYFLTAMTVYRLILRVHNK